MIDAAEAISFLVGAAGNAELAAVRARQAGHEVTGPDILVAVASDPNSITVLATQMRVQIMLQMFSALRVTEMAYLEKLDNLSAKDTAHTYTTLIKTMSELVSASAAPQNQNTLQALMSFLPPPVRESVQALLVAGEEQAAQPQDYPRVKEPVPDELEQAA